MARLASSALALVAALLVVGWRALRPSTRSEAWDGFGALCGVAPDRHRFCTC